MHDEISDETSTSQLQFSNSPEVLLRLFDLDSLVGVETFSGDSLLLGKAGLLPAHRVVLLDRRQQVVVPAGHQSSSLLKHTLGAK